MAEGSRAADRCRGLGGRGRLAALAIGLATTGCGLKGPAPAPFPRQLLISEIQEFQQTLGVERTGNFRRYSGRQRAVYRCYFTGQLELPESYEALRLIESDEPSCAVDENAYDVFFYPAEVVAGGSPVSPALADAALERVLVVVPHEDFHDQREAKEAAPDIAEAAATLIGFLTASDFARAKYGEASATFQRLDREAEIFLAKSGIVNAHYERLAGVYEAFRSGGLTRDEALARKAESFATLADECVAHEAPPTSFNGCPAAMNNAGLAFDRTYTRYYPAWFELYVALDRDTGATIGAFKRVLATGPRSEGELLDARRAWLP
jgi:hypothetical protein